MASNAQVTPIFGTTFTMFCFLKDDQLLINPKVQWRYINLLLVELDNGALGIVLKQTKCPLCDFVPLTVTAAVITDELKFTFREDSRIVSWMHHTGTDRVQVQFWLDEDFLTFVGCILHARCMRSKAPKDWMFQMEHCVGGFSRLLREVSPPSFNIAAIQAGQPQPEDIAPDAKCWCFELSAKAGPGVSEARDGEDDVVGDNFA